MIDSIIRVMAKMGEAEVLEKAQEEKDGRGNKPKGDNKEESDYMKEIFANKSDLEEFKYKSFSFFDNKNHQNNRYKDKFYEDFDPIQIGTANAPLLPLNRSDCGHRITSLLRDICYDCSAPLNRKRWEEMRGSENRSGSTVLEGEKLFRYSFKERGVKLPGGSIKRNQVGSTQGRIWRQGGGREK